MAARTASGFPSITWLMIQRVFEGKGFQRQWRPLEEISPRMVRAVIAAEDARFCEHHGFDFEAMEKATEELRLACGHVPGEGKGYE